MPILPMSRHVYWVDTYLDTLERCDYTGEHRRTLTRARDQLAGVLAITVFQNLVYLARDTEVITANKFKPNNLTV